MSRSQNQSDVYKNNKVNQSELEADICNIKSHLASVLFLLAEESVKAITERSKRKPKQTKITSDIHLQTSSNRYLNI